MIKVAIVIGSTRPGRKAEAVVRWVCDIATKRSDAEFELVDIKDFDLPLLDEPVPPDSPADFAWFQPSDTAQHLCIVEGGPTLSRLRQCVQSADR